MDFHSLATRALSTLNNKNGVDISYSSDILDTITEDSDDQTDTEVDIDAQLENLSVTACHGYRK